MSACQKSTDNDHMHVITVYAEISAVCNFREFHGKFCQSKILIREFCWFATIRVANPVFTEPV